MSFKPAEWNAIVVGAWHPGILTPAGIRERLSKLPKETPIAVEVALEEPALRVRHSGLVVAVGIDRLLAATEVASVESIRDAAALLVTAMESLDQTPVRAAGINFRYLSENPAELLEERRTALDEKLEERFKILGRGFKRSLVFEQGVINLELREEGEQILAELNFHCDSVDPVVLVSWLRRAEEFHGEVVKMLDLLGVTIGEVG